MASDKLNQIGGYIGQTREDADRALKRQRPVKPSVERTRDIFDPDVPFSMSFNVQPTQKSVTMNLEFNKPPPRNNCDTGTNIKSYCETFDGLPAGNAELSLAHAMQTGTVTVYVNGTTWPASKWAVIDYGIIDASAGRVLVTSLPNTTNTVVICYVGAYPVISLYNDPRNSPSFYNFTNLDLMIDGHYPGGPEPQTGVAQVGAGVSSGYVTYGAVLDFGEAKTVVEMQYHAYGGGHPGTTEYSSDGSSWTLIPDTWEATGYGGILTTPFPITARFWCIRWETDGGLRYVSGIDVYEWIVSTQ